MASAAHATTAPSRSQPLPNAAAKALDDIIALASDPDLEDHLGAVQAILDIARKAARLNP